MRILHVIDDLQLGGAERNLVSVVGALPQHQHHVVHLLERAAFAAELRRAGADVEWVPAERVTQYPSAIARLRRLASEVDVVHTQRWIANFVGRIAADGRAPIVTTVQTSPYEPIATAGYTWKGRLLDRAIQLADSLQSNRADLVVGVSDHVQQLIVERLRVPRAQTRRVYNAVAVDAFLPIAEPARSEVRRELGIDGADVAIVTVGHLVPLKQQRLLVEALPSLLARAPRALLILVGEGTDEPHLRRRARALGVEHRIRWLGLRSDVARFLGALDIFALASDLEGLPLSAVEAMAAALPCVLSPIPPHRELRDQVSVVAGAVADEMVVPAQQPAAWGDALARLACDPVRRATLGAQCRAAARRHFDARVTGAALASVFGEAIAGFARR